MLEKGVDWLLGWKSCRKFILLPIKNIVQNVDKFLQFLCDLETDGAVFRKVIWTEALFLWSSTYLESFFGNGTHLQPRLLTYQFSFILAKLKWRLGVWLKSPFGNGTHLRPRLLTYQFSFILAKQKWRLGVWFSGCQNVVIGWERILCNPSKEFKQSLWSRVSWKCIKNTCGPH